MSLALGLIGGHYGITKPGKAEKIQPDNTGYRGNKEAIDFCVYNCPYKTCKHGTCIEYRELFGR